MKLKLTYDPKAENCAGCVFAAGTKCRKPRDPIYKNISCVVRISEGDLGLGGEIREGMAKFVRIVRDGAW